MAIATQTPKTNKVRIDWLQINQIRLEAMVRRKAVQVRIKRAVDLVVSLFLLIILSPLFAIVSLLISLDSPGYPIYKQPRKGRHQVPFFIYKFRTMYHNSHAMRDHLFNRNEASGILFKMKRDPRITNVGRWLRLFSIDELPQLINVVKGEMSLVGPRPFSLEVFERAKKTSPDYRRWLVDRHHVLPGMTGLWQINGRNEASFNDLIRWDLEYVKKGNIILDFQILCWTVQAVLSTKGAS